MNKRRILVWVYCAVLTWVIVDIALMEVKKRGEIIALCANAAALKGKAPKLSDPAPSARAAVKWIAFVAGVAPNFELHAGEPVPSLAFAAFRNDARVIVYDKNRFRWGDNTARWQDVSVLAHEIGHHLGTHIFILGPNAHANELEADRFSGHIAARLGASLAQALSFTDQFSESGSVSHPGREKRRAAVTAGWRHAQDVKRAGGLGSYKGAAG